MISQELYESTSLVADELASILQCRKKRIVFAESCTAGLASAIMAQISGISNWLCGSAVTYRVPLKEDWLQIDPELIERFTAVSPQVTQAMASSVLLNTEDADYSIGITGHLEPDETTDGPLVFVSVGYRTGRHIACTEPQRLRLIETTRCDRQWEAARFALNVGVSYLREASTVGNEESAFTENAVLQVNTANPITSKKEMK